MTATASDEALRSAGLVGARLDGTTLVLSQQRLARYKVCSVR